MSNTTKHSLVRESDSPAKSYKYHTKDYDCALLAVSINDVLDRVPNGLAPNQGCDLYVLPSGEGYIHEIASFFWNTPVLTSGLAVPYSIAALIRDDGRTVFVNSMNLNSFRLIGSSVKLLLVIGKNKREVIQ